jgi:photosynthetic reaction center cytochrome c subunit
MNSARNAMCAAGVLFTLLIAGCERPPVDTVQRGYRGTAMVEVYNPRTLANQSAINQAPADSPAIPSDPSGPKAGQVYQNVKVLGDLGVGEFTRLMVSITSWVAPQEGCTYCHAGNNFATDDKYTKIVSRRMLEMTRHINSEWKTHVAETGVTCYTCHRGQPVPAKVWFQAPEQKQARGMVGNKAGQNTPAATVGLSSLPYDPFTPFLSQSNEIRGVGKTALPTGNRSSIKQAEHTYGLMIHMSESLGVNCTYCHNSRSFSTWDLSTPQRATAWYGIRLARDLNTNYLEPLKPTFPANRLGPTGDAPKLNCATCHQGAFKPLYGASMLKDHPALAGKPVAAAPSGAVTLPPTVSTSQGATLFFGVGSATIAGDAVPGMQALIDSLKANPGSKVSISGYHSAAGDLAQNQELAKSRAMAVRDTLRSAGVAEERFDLQKPVSAEANLTGEDPKARRVEVLVQK